MKKTSPVLLKNKKEIIIKLDKDIYCSLAKTKCEAEEALYLVYKQYAKKGYIPYSEIEAKVNEFLNSSFIVAPFVTKHKEKIIGTISIISDSELSLPIDELYKEELDELRRLNIKIAQVAHFAVDKNNINQATVNNFRKAQFSLPILLLSSVFYYAIYEELDILCIVINPKHNNFYNSLLFQDIGEEKYYYSLNNAPAIGKILYLQKLRDSKAMKYLMDLME